MKHPMNVNGVIINMAANSHGIGREAALDLLSEIKRIQGNQPQQNNPKKRGKDEGLEPKETLTQYHSQYHAASYRISEIEKALKNCAAGRPHGLKRKKWRHMNNVNNDAQYIMAVLGHVLSRPIPKTPEAKVKDAALLMKRTGEWGCLSEQDLPPMPSPDIAPIIIQADGNSLRLSDTATQDYSIKIDKKNGGMNNKTTQLTIKLKNLLPESVEAAIKARIDQALHGRGVGPFIMNGYYGSNLADIEAHHFIDWVGLRGPMKAWLVGAGINDNMFDDYQYNLKVEVENAILEGAG